MTIALAPDPIFPYRDALLDPQYVASLLASRFDWATAIVRAERVRATYRIGTSLRIRHRFEAGGRTYETLRIVTNLRQAALAGVVPAAECA